MLTTQPSQKVQHSRNITSNFTTVQRATTSFNQGQYSVQPPSYEQSMNIGSSLSSNNTNYPQPVVIQTTNVVPTHYGYTHRRNRWASIISLVIFVAVTIVLVVVFTTRANNAPEPAEPSLDFDGFNHFDSNF